MLKLENSTESTIFKKIFFLQILKETWLSTCLYQTQRLTAMMISMLITPQEEACFFHDLWI